MKSWVQQLYMFRAINRIRQALSPIRFSEHHYRYYRKAYQDNRSQLFKFVFFSFGVILFEVTAPLYLDRIFRTLSYQLNINYLITALGILLVVLVTYLYFNYQSIKIKKTVSLRIVNNIRKDWITNYIEKKALGIGLRDQANVYVKLSYHLSLFQLGLSNSLLAIVEWILMFVGILTVTAIFSNTLFLLSLVLLPIPFLILFISYYLSAYYLAQDQTLYSRLMRMLTINFGNFPQLKNTKKKNEFIKNIDETVELDTYFRIRRELVFRLTPKIIFAIISFVSAALYLVNLYGSFSALSELGPLVHTLVFALYLKFIYLSLNIGLYVFPLKLGAYLVAPREILQDDNKEKISNIESLEVYAQKIKIHHEDIKHEKFHAVFKKGKSYLICIPHEREHLAHLLAAYALDFGTKKWIFKINEKYRYNYQEWVEVEIDRYYLNLQNYPETKVVDYLGGTLNVEKLAQYPIFSFIFERRSFLNERVHQSNFKPHEFVLLQAAYLLIHKPDLIVIDPLVVDLPYPQVHQALSLVTQELKESIIVAVSHYYPVTHTNFDYVTHL